MVERLDIVVRKATERQSEQKWTPEGQQIVSSVRNFIDQNPRDRTVILDSVLVLGIHFLRAVVCLAGVGAVLLIWQGS